MNSNLRFFIAFIGNSGVNVIYFMFDHNTVITVYGLDVIKLLPLNVLIVCLTQPSC